MRIRYVRRVLLVVLLTVSVTSCTTLSVVREDRLVRQRFRQDVGSFFGVTSEAYFILSYEYHNLAQEHQKKGDSAQADVYDKKATLYYNLSKDLDRASKAFLSESLSR